MSTFTRIEARRLARAGADSRLLARLAFAVAELREPTASPMVAASGTTQATAPELLFSYSVVTSASVGSGLRLPASSDIGDQFWVRNMDAANTLLLYPPSGGRINANALNAGQAIPINRIAHAIRLTSTDWYVTLNAN